MRVGIGYDIHRLKKGRRLLLGTVEIPFEKGLEGHSDGDALSHAVVDAVLGAMSAGDIGQLFPDTDKRHLGAPSAIFLEAAARIAKKKGFRVAHIDAVVVAEAPKLAPYVTKIAVSIAGFFGMPTANVSIKGKTNEGLGPVGEGRAIACTAVATLMPSGKR